MKIAAPCFFCSGTGVTDFLAALLYNLPPDRCEPCNSSGRVYLTIEGTCIPGRTPS